MKPKWKFSVAGCSVCENVTLVLGDSSWGGIRYCEECLHLSFGWFSARAPTKDGITKLFEEKRVDPKVVILMEKAKGISAEEKKAISIGEAKNRMFKADIEEANRP